MGTALYNGKSAFNSSAAGIYIGTDGISMGAVGVPTFSVNAAGELTVQLGTIAG